MSIEAVKKSYGRTEALKGITFSALAGEFVVLLGPNGAGKSTLVQLLTGLFVPDAGTVIVAGHDLRKNPVAALREIGVVFQQSTLDLELSVAANLRFHADLHGIGRAVAAARIADGLDRFDLTRHARQSARTLSGGNRRRLELARALLHEPTILIMDEPTVGLDPASRRDLIGHILSLVRERGILVLWTTHLIDEAERADQLIFLNGGEIVFAGTREAALRSTKTGTVENAFFALTNRKLAEVAA